MQLRLSRNVDASDVRVAFELMEFSLYHETATKKQRRKKGPSGAGGEGGDDDDEDGEAEFTGKEAEGETPPIALSPSRLTPPPHPTHTPTPLCMRLLFVRACIFA